MASFGDDCIFTSSDGTKSTPSPPNSHSKSSSKSSKNTNNSSLGNSEIADAILTHNGQIDKDIKEHDTDVQSHSESPSTKFATTDYNPLEIIDEKQNDCTEQCSEFPYLPDLEDQMDEKINDLDADDVLSHQESASTKSQIWKSFEFENSVSTLSLSINPTSTLSLSSQSISLNYQVSTTGTRTPTSPSTTIVSTTFDNNPLKIIDEKQKDLPHFFDIPLESSQPMIGHKKNKSPTYKIFPIQEHLNDTYKWSIKILNFDVSRIEIGVVSVKEANTQLDKKGIIHSQNFGARAIYGMDLINDSVYYASYHKDGYKRCFKSLSKDARWKRGDVIGIYYDKCKIKFYVNNEKVRKALSLGSSNKYYPIIAISSGYCSFEYP